MDSNTLPTDVLWKIINLLTYCIGTLLAIGLSVFVYFHKSLLRRLDSIDADLKPMRIENAVQKQINEELRSILDEHHRRISDLENR